MAHSINTPVTTRWWFSILLVIGFVSGCADVNKDDHHHDHNHGLPTTAILNLEAEDGTTHTFRWAQADSHDEATVDLIELQANGAIYEMSVQILNEAGETSEDITPEIAQYATEHQLFFTGSAVEGPATATNPEAVLLHAYGDEDDNELPIGIDNTITVLGAGSGELSVMLRHMPAENGQAVKTPEAAETVATDGFSALGGDIDLDVTFTVLVE
jgi:hypothetical protein